MLVLSRHVGEIIVIGEGDRQVSIKVVEIMRGRVKIGIQAPADIPIKRSELIRVDRQDTQEGGKR